MAIQPRPLKSLTRTLSVLLAVNLLSLPLAVAATYTLLGPLDRSPHAAIAAYGLLKLAFAHGWADAWRALPFVISLAVGIVYWVWLYRAASLARWQQPERMRMSPGALVAWSLVPVANLFMPMIGILQMWRAIAPHRRPTAILWAWWVLGTGASVFEWMPQWLMQHATDAATLAHAVRLDTWVAIPGALATILLMIWTRRLAASLPQPSRAGPGPAMGTNVPAPL